MAHAGRVVALGLTLLVGGLGGYVISQSQKPVTVTTSAAAEVARTVEVTVQAEPVTATVTVEPQPTDDPAGPKANGNYLVGPELVPGTWKCGKAGSLTTWFVRDQTNGVADFGSGTLAVVNDGAYIADLNDCAGTWTLVTR